MCIPREPTGPSLNPKRLPNPNTLSEFTAGAASPKGSLRNLARRSNDVAVARKLYSDLLKEGVGTTRIEKEAYNNLRDQKGINNLAKREGKISTERIREGRDPRIVREFWR